jgi:hypothetical protein
MGILTGKYRREDVRLAQISGVPLGAAGRATLSRGGLTSWPTNPPAPPANVSGDHGCGSFKRLDFLSFFPLAKGALLPSCRKSLSFSSPRNLLGWLNHCANSTDAAVQLLYSATPIDPGHRSSLAFRRLPNPN